jgi:hypothetical protein
LLKSVSHSVCLSPDLYLTLIIQAMTYCHRAKGFDESCEEILSRTRGAPFLGVPNPLGSSTSWFGEYIGKIHRSGYGVDQSTSIDLANKFSVEFGEMFRTDFEIFQVLSQSQGWSTFTFYESKETMTRYGPILVSFPSSKLFIPGLRNLIDLCRLLV